MYRILHHFGWPPSCMDRSEERRDSIWETYGELKTDFAAKQLDLWDRVVTNCRHFALYFCIVLLHCILTAEIMKPRFDLDDLNLRFCYCIVLLFLLISVHLEIVLFKTRQLFLDHILTKLREEAYDQQLDRGYYQMLVNIWISKQVQCALDILSHEIKIFRCKVSTSKETWDCLNNRLCTFALDFCRFCACWRLSRRGQSVIGEDSASQGLQNSREQFGAGQPFADLEWHQPAKKSQRQYHLIEINCIGHMHAHAQKHYRKGRKMHVARVRCSFQAKRARFRFPSK